MSRPVLHEMRTCRAPRCARRPKALGLCGTHYVQRRRGKRLTAIRQRDPQERTFSRKRPDNLRRWITVGLDADTEKAFMAAAKVEGVSTHALHVSALREWIQRRANKKGNRR